VAGTSANPPAGEFDPAQIIETLDRHGVDYLLIGGVAGNVYGAQRLTQDIDCIAERSVVNLTRLAAALRELDARPRIHDAPDSDLRMTIDAVTLHDWQQSTWRTTAAISTSSPTSLTPTVAATAPPN
jgi:hypothetical protein